AELPGPVARRMLETLSPAERGETLALLQYSENSAGRMMTPDFLHLSGGDTALSALEKVRRLAGEVETVYQMYVIDAEHRLVGIVSLRDVVIAEPGALIRDFMTRNFVFSFTAEDREEVLHKMREYDLLALPVVDSQQRLVGIVTFDDASDVHADEATEDILKMHGVATKQDDYFNAGLFSRFRQRAVWLIALALVAGGSVLVQQAYNPVIVQLSLLAAYITMLTASSGNCGTQSSGILIRAISSGEYDRKQLTRIFRGEITLGLVLALTMSVVGVLLVLARGADQASLGGHSVFEVALIVGSAMFMAVLTTNALGAAIPLMLRALKVDPAVAAGPFITTAADIITVLVYFNIAQWVVIG
ncbi:MAG: magnesium transporter, partial [Nitrospira sp.]|nr:magnesium transporter [Nitrospira sp.]